MEGKGEGQLTTVEAIIPGLDFANHGSRANCRWELANGAQVRSSVLGLSDQEIAPGINASDSLSVDTESMVR